MHVGTNRIFKKRVPLYIYVPEFCSPGCKDSEKGLFFWGTQHFTLNPKPYGLRSTLHSPGPGSNPVGSPVTH